MKEQQIYLYPKTSKIRTMYTFKEYPKFIEMYLKSENIKYLMPSQSIAVKYILNRKSLLLCASAQCGKTFAVLLPVLSKLFETNS